MVRRDVLFATESLSIERFRREDTRAKQLAFVFNHLGSRLLNENINGGDFLVEQGFDVVNVKTTARDWYQSVPAAAFDAIDRSVCPADYDRRAAMGSSMGGFAAIAFSKRLRCDTVLAYAPQHDETIQSDPRFAGFVEDIEWAYRVSDETISDTCRYCVVFDRRDHYDAVHAARLRSIIPSRNYAEIIVPFAGHAVAFYLMEVGQLKRVSLDVLAGRPVRAADLRKNRRRSRQYLSVLAAQLRFGNHPRLAAAVQRLDANPYAPLPVSERALRRGTPILAPFLEAVEMLRLAGMRFDRRFYAHIHYDVPGTALGPLRHYVRHGRLEGRIVRFGTRKGVASWSARLARARAVFVETARRLLGR